MKTPTVMTIFSPMYVPWVRCFPLDMVSLILCIYFYMYQLIFFLQLIQYKEKIQNNVHIDVSCNEICRLLH